MGKKSRLKKLRREGKVEPNPLMWSSKDGIHALGCGQPPTALEIAKMTADFQDQIRTSPLWEQMVKEFGEEKATELLKECTVRIDEQA